MFSLRRLVLTAISSMFPMLFTACGPADFLHPLFLPSERMLLPGLEGQWVRQSEKETQEEILTFETHGTDSYRLLVGEQSEPYDGFLGRLGGACYLEIIPDKKIRKEGRFKIMPASIHGREDPALSSFFIADGLYLTLRQRTSSQNLPEELELQIQPTRQILKLELKGDLLKVWCLDEDEIRKGLDRGEFMVSHIRWQDKLLVTASTEELQAFLLNCDRDPQSTLFTEADTYRRIWD
ncbi:MAG: hypothetical protein L7F78_09935 [Syntrophales bacterium LBB04]|nr:hypothetical protein [Syntrophales bacterium LBB04]